MKKILNSVSGTFDTTDSPEPGMRKIAFGFLWLRLDIVHAGVGGVTYVGSGVKPVVRAYSDSHQAESCKSPRGRQNHLNPKITPRHGAS